MKKLLSSLLVAMAASGFVSNVAAQDAKAGEQKATMCIGCHGIPGYQASFPEVYKVPMISGQGDKYIVAALTGYKKGERKHPTMRAIAGSLSDKDMADLAAFYSTQVTDLTPVAAKPAREPSAQVAELLKKGNCISCHGDNFSKPIDASYPKLAGQHPDYLYVALKSYQGGTAVVGRGNAIMGGMAKPFSHSELKAIAQYIGSLDSELRVVPQSRFR
jgi:cytochrome c553